MKNFDPFHKSKIVYLLKINDFAFMVWVKNFVFDHADGENLRYLAETKKQCAKFFKGCKVHENVSENY